ncbi:hypothetical protein PV325_002014 [Microctonus aethiopoides]|nr:hypothetical protein PV325_002014 [Microctonus aethiopoides]
MTIYKLVLQKDIEAHGRIVSSVVKLGERVAKQQGVKEQKQHQEQNFECQQDQSGENFQHPNRQLQSIRIANSLERRWHLLFLRALEWQCHIETLATRVYNKSAVSCRCSSDSDEEPVTKQPRLSRRQSRDYGKVRDISDGHRGRVGRKGVIRHCGSSSRRRNCEIEVNSSCCSDSDMSSGSQHNDEESYFEDDLEQLCVTETKANSVEKPTNSSVQGDQGEEGDIEEVSDDEMPPILNTTATMAPISDVDEVDGFDERITNGSMTILNDSPKRRKTFDETSTFNTSDRKSKNCATFYFKHRDTDSEADVVQNQNELTPHNGIDESSEEEWTYTTTTSLTDNCQVLLEQKKTNVVVRLDFGEPVKVEKIENLEFMREDMKIMEEDEEENDKQSKEFTKNGGDSEDETKNDIQRLILEVEKLVSEEGRNGVSKSVSAFILEDQGTNGYRAKYARIKEWLKLNSNHYLEDNSSSQNWQPLDSCDASGEYTTGESDGEKQSESSEDLQSSVATYRRSSNSKGLGCVSQSVSQETFKDNDKTSINDINQQMEPIDMSSPKVVMRTKKKSDGPRPWSVSCVFRQLNSTNESNISQLSISETALHQLITSPPTKSASFDDAGSRAPFNNSATTLLEEPSRSIRNTFIRKKKSRLRKKNLSRKSESGSDVINALNSGGSDSASVSNNQRSCMRKFLDNRGVRTSSSSTTSKPDCYRCIVSLMSYGSTISCPHHNEGPVEKGIVSVPPPSIKLICCTPDPASSGDTEDINCTRKHKNDNIINIENVIINRNDAVSSPINCDSDIEKNSLGNNSFSEQAWDSYQEKYMSEPYSEAADVETARRLLEFGDDYRNFLDSQSDCASSFSAVRSCSSPIISSGLNCTVAESSGDSDSDTEDHRRLIEKSYKKLLVMENHFARANGIRAMKDNMELEYVCKENIRCLQTVMQQNNSRRGEKSLKRVCGKYDHNVIHQPTLALLLYGIAILVTALSLTERWENLSQKAEEAQRASVLQREMAAMHLEFRAAHERLSSHEIILGPAHVIEKSINSITYCGRDSFKLSRAERGSKDVYLMLQTELATLRERKNAMLALNVSAHRLITDLGAAATSVSVSLKDTVADLYRVWDETFQSLQCKQMGKERMEVEMRESDRGGHGGAYGFSRAGGFSEPMSWDYLGFHLGSLL